MTPNLLPCPFCGSADVEIQGKPAILDALDSVCCNECTADAPYPAWNTRAQLPSQGGEAVAWLTSDKRHLVFSGALDQSQYVEQGMTPLYTHPADQVADDLTMVKVSRELLVKLLDEGRRAETWAAQDELRALLAKSEGEK